MIWLFLYKMLKTFLGILFLSNSIEENKKDIYILLKLSTFMQYDERH